MGLQTVRRFISEQNGDGLSLVSTKKGQFVVSVGKGDIEVAGRWNAGPFYRKPNSEPPIGELKKKQALVVFETPGMTQVYVVAELSPEERKSVEASIKRSQNHVGSLRFSR